MRAKSHSLPSTKFPLPEGCFTSSPLSEAQLAASKTQIESLIARALDESERAVYGSSWELVSEETTTNVVRGWESRPTTSGSSTRSHYRLIGDVSGDYRDLMGFHYAETSHELYEWLQFMHHTTLDAHVLQNVETATPSTPHHYFGVKWAVFQHATFATKIDQCFLEYMTYRKDLCGQDVGIRVTLPIRMPEIDLTMEALKVRRLSVQMVQILRPTYDTTSPCTRMFMMIENDLPLSTPSAYTKSLLSMNQNLAMGVDARRIRQRGLVPEKLWVRNSARRRCAVCTQKFGVSHGRHHCRLCGEVICRKCVVVRDTADPTGDKTFRVVQTKFCAICVRQVGEPDDDDDAGAKQTLREEHVVRDDRVPSDASTWSAGDSDRVGCESTCSSSYLDPEEDEESFIVWGQLEQIAERVDDTSSRPTTSRRDRTSPSTETVLLGADEMQDAAEFVVTIDTHDMQRVASSSSSPTFVGSNGDAWQLGSTPLSRYDAWRRSRSIDESLAEQESLLRQIARSTQRSARPPESLRGHEFVA